MKERRLTTEEKNNAKKKQEKRKDNLKKPTGIQVRKNPAKPLE